MKSTHAHSRTMFFALSGLVLAPLAALHAAEAPQPEVIPNILFLLTDDQRDGTFGAMGHPFVKTPNADRLLEQSVRFRNAYIAEPTCAPSRAALLTGMHERVNGVGFTSSYQLTDAQWAQTYPALVREAGYYTGFIGKFGIEYYTFRGLAATKFDFWRGHDGWTRFFPKESDVPNCTPYHEATEDVITMIMGEMIAEFLDSAPKDKPFCLSVSFSVPHGSQTRSMSGEQPPMTRPANENPKLKGAEKVGSGKGVRNLFRSVVTPRAGVNRLVSRPAGGTGNASLPAPPAGR